MSHHHDVCKDCGYPTCKCGEQKMSKQYVRHVSGNGEKWLVDHRTEYGDWVINKGTHNLIIPVSEYVTCEPPERWVDVTEECDCNKYKDDIMHNEVVIMEGKGYRLRKVTFRDTDNLRWAFIVEKKVCE